MAVSLSCAEPEPLTPPVGIRPRLSTVVWAMVMGENEEVGCGLWCVVCGLWFVVCGVWFVACGLWCVLSPPPSDTFELGEQSYTIELSHVRPAVPLSRVVGHPSIHPG